jgi:hypothetical protein
LIAPMRSGLFVVILVAARQQSGLAPRLLS